jgi:hypothetical protein
MRVIVVHAEPANRKARSTLRSYSEGDPMRLCTCLRLLVRVDQRMFLRIVSSQTDVQSTWTWKHHFCETRHVTLHDRWPRTHKRDSLVDDYAFLVVTPNAGHGSRMSVSDDLDVLVQ